MYFRYLNFAFFENRHHPSLSLALELYTVTVYSRRAAWMYEKPSCHDFGTYRYMPVRTGQEFLYLHVPVHTSAYRYIPVHTILPDPVQVYRIPDELHPLRTFGRRGRRLCSIMIYTVSKKGRSIPSLLSNCPPVVSGPRSGAGILSLLRVRACPSWTSPGFSDILFPPAMSPISYCHSTAMIRILIRVIP
jgi:hypothetical protein